MKTIIKSRSRFKTDCTCSFCDTTAAQVGHQNTILVLPQDGFKGVLNSNLDDNHTLIEAVSIKKDLYRVMANARIIDTPDSNTYHLRFGSSYVVTSSIFQTPSITICKYCLAKRSNEDKYSVYVDGTLPCVICKLSSTIMIDLLADRLFHHISEAFPVWGDQIRSTLLIHKRCAQYKLSMWPQ